MARQLKADDSTVAIEEGTNVVEAKPETDYVAGVEHMAETGRIPGAFMNLPGDMQAMIRVVAYGFLALIQVLNKK